MAPRWNQAAPDDPAAPDADGRAEMIERWLDLAIAEADPSPKDGGAVPLPEGQAMAALDREIIKRAFAAEPADAAARASMRELAWRAAQESVASANQALKSNDRDAALRAVMEAASLDVQNADKWTALSRFALEQGAAPLADAASRRATLLEPSSAPAHAARAETLFALDRIEAGKAHLLAAIRHGAENAAGASDAVFRCHSRIAPSERGERNFFDDVADAAIEIGDRRKAIAAFVKGAARARDSDLPRTLLRLGDSGLTLRPASKRQTPLVLISQVQRSGGTLLSQLFDGHPEIFGHPHELHIGTPNKWNWPKVDLGAPPLEILNTLFETVFLKFMVRGYSKGDGNKAAAEDFRRFDLSIETLVTEFKRLAAAAVTQRDLIDAYLRAFFAAWGQHAPTGRELYTVGFVPRLIAYDESVDGFFADYPDGRLIICIRDPVSWFASSSRHDAEYESIDNALALWRASTEAALKHAQARPDSVHLLTYESLVMKTPAVMRRIAHWLGVKYAPILTMPTYAGQAMLPNSSYAIRNFGVHKNSLAKEGVVDKRILAETDREALPAYNAAIEAIRAQNDRLASRKASPTASG